MEAERLMKRCLSCLGIYQEALAPDHPKVALALNALAETYSSLGRYADAEPLLKCALTIAERSIGPDRPELALILNNLAGVYGEQGDHDRAEPLLQRALSIYEVAHGAESAEVALILSNLAEGYNVRGQSEQAETLFRRSLELKEKALGAGHPSVGMTLNNLAGVYGDQKRYAEAEPLLRRALEVMESALGPDHPRVAMVLDNLAVTLLENANREEARVLHERALVIYTKTLGKGHPSVKRVAAIVAAYERQQSVGDHTVSRFGSGGKMDFESGRQRKLYKRTGKVLKQFENVVAIPDNPVFLVVHSSTMVMVLVVPLEDGDVALSVRAVAVEKPQMDQELMEYLLTMNSDTLRGCSFGLSDGDVVVIGGIAGHDAGETSILMMVAAAVGYSEKLGKEIVARWGGKRPKIA